MFTKTSFAKLALAPLAVATLLSTLASASPAPEPVLQVRGDNDYPPSTTSSGYWPKKTGDCDCDFDWDKDHVPKITQPNKDTIWKVGDHQKVTWEVKWDDKKDGGYDNGKGWQDSKDGKDWQYGKDGKDGKDWDDGKKCQWNDNYGKDGKDDDYGKDGKGDDYSKDGKEHGCKTRLFLRKGDDLPFLILAESFDIKAGSVDVTVPNVFFGTDYRVVLSVRDDKPELQSNSEKFKIVKDDKDWNDCKDGKDKDGKDCKDWKNGNNGGY